MTKFCIFEHKQANANTSKKIHILPVFGLLCLGLMPVDQASAQSATTPAFLQITGSITSITGIPQIRQTDEVQVIRVEDNEIIATGSIISGSGGYFISMSEDEAFNGTELTLNLSSGSQIYQLSFGTTNSFDYQGSFPFPTRLTINATVGSQSGGPVDPSDPDDNGDGDGDGTDGDGDGSDGDGGTGGDGGDTGGGSNIAYDANSDGVFDQADIDFITEAIADGVFVSSADVYPSPGGDGRLNTRDAIAAIKELQRQSRNGQSRISFQ